MANSGLDKSRFRVLGELFWQLRFTPGATLLEQTYRAERLVRMIDPTKRYPYDFICFKLTDYKPKETVAIEPLVGEDVLADLARFISDVSSRNPVGTDQLPEPAFSVGELVEQAGVSAKTLRRWSRYGLVGRHVTAADGRRCQVVLVGTWQWFMDRYESRVARAAAFSRVSVAQRRGIVAEARNMFRYQGLKRSRIETVLAERMGRARETVRYILKRHDASAGAEDRVFPTRTRIGPADRLRIWRMSSRGVSPDDLARIYGRSISSIYRIIHSARQQYWRQEQIDYVYSPEFDMPDAAQTILPAVEMQISTRPGSVDRLEVLTVNQERELFRAYNYLKFRQH